MDELEQEARINTAALYRLIAMQGWDDLVGTHVSARIPGPEPRFLLNPYGMLFEEITASSLLSVNLDGRQLTDSPYTYNRAGFTIHSAVHMHRHDAEYVIHLHTDYGVAVSCQKDGLKPMNQTAIAIHADLAYHDYEGVATNLGERERLVRDLERACKYQILAESGGAQINQMSDDIIQSRQDISSTATLKKRGEFIWPALLRKLDRIDSSYRE